MMGDGNAPIPTPQPVIARPMFGAYGGARLACAVHFVSRAGLESGAMSAARLSVAGAAATLAKKDPVMNDALPKIESRDLRGPRRRSVAHLRAGGCQAACATGIF
jgi:urease subunit alpha